MTQLLDILGDKVTSHAERADTLQRVQTVVFKSTAIVGLAAIWGFAAGLGSPKLALANLYKVPMVVTLSALIALPAMFVARHLLKVQVQPLRFFNALIGSLFNAALILVAFAPLVAIYSYTSQWFAPILAQASALVAGLVAAGSLHSKIVKLDAPRGLLLIIGFVTMLALALAVLQLLVLATPILPKATVFGAGIDGFLR